MTTKDLIVRVYVVDERLYAESLKRVGDENGLDEPGLIDLLRDPTAPLDNGYEIVKAVEHDA